MSALEALKRAGILLVAAGVPLAILFARFPESEAPSFVKGQKIFLSRCAACHAIDRGDVPKVGPDLRDFSNRAGQRVPRLSAVEYTVESIFEPTKFVVGGYPAAMPGQLLQDLSDEDIRELIGFLLSQGGDPPLEEIADVKLPSRKGPAEVQIERDEMQLAVETFFGKGQCAACHATHSQPQDAALAPPIFNVGLDAARIRSGIETPNDVTEERYRAARVHLASSAPSEGLDARSSSGGDAGAGDNASRNASVDLPDARAHGEVVEGTIVRESGDHVVLLTLHEGTLVERVIPRSAIERNADGTIRIDRLSRSLKPRNYSVLLSQPERDALVKLLVLLN